MDWLSFWTGFGFGVAAGIAYMVVVQYIQRKL